MKRHLLWVFLALCTFSQAFAWGPRGHKIVAQIARHYTDKSVMDSVEHYLDDISLEKAGYWMDEMMMNSSYDFMLPWHFVMIDSDKTYVRTNKPDIITVLENTIAALKKRPINEKEMFLSLKIVTHLIADIHQPLHCGFAKDKRGAAVKLRFFFKSTNLHDIWDNDILDYQSLTAEDCLRLGSQLTKKDIANYQKIDVISWMEESRELLSYVYDFKGNKVGDEYLEKVTPIVKMQLLKAGLRLAAVLNQTFKK